uniref:Uncharacterized protein n=1 Tax=Podoviridae sp. ct8dV2 TaxID=2825222 RepID=A0A8S5PP16_9CAUD|nr:MAG TPA: hypothetical protein [Podoviridae sp. ct8dV2]
MSDGERKTGCRDSGKNPGTARTLREVRAFRTRGGGTLYGRGAFRQDLQRRRSGFVASRRPRFADEGDGAV